MKNKILTVFLSIVVSLAFIMPGGSFGEAKVTKNSAPNHQLTDKNYADTSQYRKTDVKGSAKKKTYIPGIFAVSSNKNDSVENGRTPKCSNNMRISPARSPLGNTAWSQLAEKVKSAGNNAKKVITINENIVADSLKDSGRTILVNKNQNIVFKGKGSIKGIGFKSIKVMRGGSLTIDGPSLSNTQIIVEGKLNLKAGKISDTKLEGPTIFVNSGEFTVQGGAITGNEAIESQSPAPSELRKAGNNYQYSPVTVYNGTFRLNAGEITGNKGFLKGGAIGAWGTGSSKAKVIIEGGTIKENIAVHQRFNAWGGAVYIEDCEFKMSGGAVSQNSAEYGGGINIVKSTAKFSGGSITENTNGNYSGKGGGIYASDTDLEFKNVNVSKNTANGPGGALFALCSESEKHFLNVLGGDFKSNATVNNGKTGVGGAFCVSNYTYRIDGGNFIDNSAVRMGGAISFSSKSTGTINAGMFKNNSSNGFWGGGAIFNDNNCTMVIKRALIKENTIEKSFMIGAGNHPASRQGGGIWNCPDGNTEIHITNGLALFDNSAPNLKGSNANNGAGDDFINITQYRFNEVEGALSQIKLASRMLGGGYRLWYQDGSFYGSHTNLSESEQTPRYNPKDPGKPLPYGTVIKEKRGAQLAYKSVPSKDSKELAQRVATSIFQGNKALSTGISGGGISNNGKLIFGEDTPYILKIVKSWTGDNSEKRPDEIKLKMYVGGHYIQDVNLSAKENWTFEIKDFPDPNSLVDNKTGKILPITFKEEKTGKYILSIKNKIRNEKKRIYTINLDNARYTSVKVTKKWVDNNNKYGKRPAKITVGLIVNGKYSGKKIVISKKDNWKGMFKKLPLYADNKLIEYDIKEISKIKGYTSKIERERSKSGEEGEISYIVTNKQSPNKKPAKKAPNKKTVNTGDKSNIGLYAVLLGLALVLLVVVGMIKRKRH